MKNTVSVDSKELSVYITCKSAGKITDYLVMLKKKTTDPKYRRGMTFTQNKKPTNTSSMEKKTNYPFTFFGKTQEKRSFGSKLENKPQTAISGTKHTVTTDKNKIIHRKFFFLPVTLSECGHTYKANQHKDDDSHGKTILLKGRRTSHLQLP